MRITNPDIESKDSEPNRGTATGDFQGWGMNDDAMFAKISANKPIFYDVRLFFLEAVNRGLTMLLYF